jgi:hypothetical protein
MDAGISSQPGSEASAAHFAADPGPRSSGRFRLGHLRQIRERTAAQLVARECLGHYQDLCAEQPQLTGYARFREVIARQSGIDARGIDLVIVRAELFRALSGLERSLDLRDIARALAIHRCLRWRSTQLSRMADCSDIISDEIPAGL